MSETKRLKAELWKRFGSKENPAEWDGHIHGGGKLSQRFWEYFKAIELLELDRDSVIIDIGGGSPTTGVGFFGALLSTVVRKVVVFDTNIAESAVETKNVEFVRSHASYESLKSFLECRPEITHISCISVFEHIEPEIREGIVRAINGFFHGQSFVATFEFHARHTFFEYQLTAQTVSSVFDPFTDYYLDTFCASPVWCENAFDNQRFFKLSRKTPITAANIPLWYPVAVRFVRVSDENLI